MPRISKPSTPVTSRWEYSTIVSKAYSGMNSPWQSGQDVPHPSLEPVLVTVAPISSTMNMPIVAATASHFAARSIGGSVAGEASPSRQNLPGLGLVNLHLSDEVVEGVEASVGADALQEIGGKRLAVEVAVEIEQVRLDHALTGIDGRPAADVGDGRSRCLVTWQPAPRGVDAVRQRRQPVRRDDVGGWESNL